MPGIPRLLSRFLLCAAIYVGFRWTSGSEVQKQEPFLSKHENEGGFVRRIVAVGDLHGDMGNALDVLQMADVVDHEGNWTGNIDYFVQTGDIIDRGDDTIKLFMWMEALRAQARSVGGDVLLHLGNHEWMNILGDWRYVYPSEISTFGSVAARQKMLSTGRIGRSWRQNYTVTSRLPLHPSLGPPNTDFDPKVSLTPLTFAALSFVHGGLSPTFQHLTPYPSRINEIGRSLLHRVQSRPFPPPHPPNPYHGLPHDSTQAEKSLYDTDGPLWYRGWATENEPRICGAIDGVLARTGVRRLIMGHTPDFDKIVSRCDGKIIIIDTGISHAYGGALSALSITYSLTPKSESERLLAEREVVVALYPDREEILVVDERDIVGSLEAL